jgi:RHS repeat-associated protein
MYRLLSVLLAIGLALGVPSVSAAQPWVSVDPSYRSSTSDQITVTVDFCSETGGLSQTNITLNGNYAMGDLPYIGTVPGCGGSSARHRGTLQLNLGENYLDAYAYDWEDSYGSAGGFYVVEESTRWPAGIGLTYSQTFRDASKCVASCFAATAQYSTPAYRSVDAERGVTLLYRSDRAQPVATLYLTLADASPTPVVKYSLRLRRPDMSYVQFLNGTTTLYFAGGSGNTPVAAQFDASSMSTGVYSYTAVVQSLWADGDPVEGTATVKFMIVNDASSEFGAGWRIAQHQRGYVQGDGSFFIVSGDGSTSVFSACGGTCQLPSPAGDLSTLNRNADGTYTRRYPDGSTFKFSSTGLLTQIADRYATIATVNWTSGRVSSIVDPAGYSIALNYDGSGKISTIVTPGLNSASRTSSFQFSGGADLLQAWDPDIVNNFVATYSNHRLQTLTDRRGGVWDFTYSSDFHVDSVAAPTIAVILGNPPSSDTIATNRRPATKTAAPAKEILVRLAQNTQGSSGNPVTRGLDLRASVRNPRSQTVYFTFHQYGSPTKIHYPLGDSTVASYDGNGLPLQVNGPGASSFTYTWSGMHLHELHDNNANYSVYARYEGTYNRPDSVWDGTSKRRFTYSGQYTLTAKMNNDPVTTYAQDGFGRVTQVTDAGSHVSKTYVAASGLRNTDSVEAPGLRRTKMRYDNFGRLVATVHPNGARDSTTYNLINRVTATTDGLNYTTTYAYDGLFLTSVTDANSQVYTFTRNALGWLEQEWRPGSSSAILTGYDLNGNAVRAKDRGFAAVWTSYDALDRVVSVSAPGVSTATYSYVAPTATSEGSMTSANAESSDELFVNAAGRVTRTKVTRASTSSWYETAYVYNLNGSLDSIKATSSTWSGTKVRRYGYTSTGKLNSVHNWAGGTSFTIDGEGLPSAVTYPNNLSLTRSISSLHGSYNNQFNNLGVNAGFGSQLSLDALGRISERANGVGELSTKFQYDTVGRVTRERRYEYEDRVCSGGGDKGFYDCNHAASTLLSDITFSYDAVGNRSDGTTITTGNRLTAVGSYTFGYDGSGNLITKSGPSFSQTLKWNALGQLDTVTTNGTTVTFGYDATGRRVRKTVGGTTTRFLHEGDDLFMRLDASGNPSTEYTYLGLDQPLMMYEGGNTYYFMQDPVSRSVKGLVRHSDNAISADIVYGAFGAVEGGTNVTTNTIWFAGREYDSETQLVYNRARYYDSFVGRFISEDPIGLYGGHNLYSYVDNDPVNHRDPSGLAKCSAEKLEQGYVSVSFERDDGSESWWCIPGGGAGLPPINVSASLNPPIWEQSLFGASQFPVSGAPNSSMSYRNTLRFWDATGRPTDFDFHKPHGPQTYPHAHDFKKGPNGEWRRIPNQWRPVNPGELSSQWSPRVTFLTLLTRYLGTMTTITVPVLVFPSCYVPTCSLRGPGA